MLEWGAGMSAGAKVFVALVFLLCGAAFLATTVSLAYEFGLAGDTRPLGEQRWFSLAALYSHLFIFFPTFGLVALIAFYLPCVVFVDLYWKYVKAGQLRFIVGTIVVAGTAYLLSGLLLGGSERSIFELHPRMIEADRGTPANCASRPAGCDRLPVTRVIDNVRTISSARTGLSPFARDCSPDPLVERPRELDERRFCFITNDLPAKPEQYRTAEQCCAAQQSLIRWLSEQHAKPDGRSLTADVHAYTLPFKVFFLLVVFVVGILLAWRHKLIYDHYASYTRRLEIGVLVGASVMLFWPIMNHAYFQSASVIHGGGSGSFLRGMGPLFSLCFLGWSLLLLLYFYRQYERETEMFAKIGGLMVSGLAIINYQTIIDMFVWLAGAGASVWSVAGIGLICAIALGRLSLSAVFIERPWSELELERERELQSRPGVTVAPAIRSRFRSDDRTPGS